MKRLLSIILFSGVLLVVGCKKEEPEDTKIPPVTSVGAFYQGGIVVYVDDSGQHGLIITEHDIDTCKWTNESSNFRKLFSNEFLEANNTEGNSQYVGKGDLFTKTIVDSLGTGHYAAKVCYDLVLNGYSDWFLPSNGELFLALTSEIFLTDSQADGLYWGSLETNASGAFVTTIKTSTMINSRGKDNYAKVRAFRKF